MKEGTILFHLLVTANFIKFPYPPVQRNEKFLDTYYGVQVHDPYRWLEQDSYATKKFIKAQKKLTDEFFMSIPEREVLRKSLTSMLNYKSFDCPSKKGSRYFYSENSGQNNQSVIYTQETLSSEPEVVLDPNTFSEDESILLGEYTISEDGELLAYVQLKEVSDTETVHFRNISSGEDLPGEILEHTKAPDLAWTRSEGIFYTKYPVEKDGTTSTLNGKIYYHLLGTKQKDDILIAEFPTNPKWIISVEVSHCGEYLILSATDSYQTNAVFVASLESLFEFSRTNSSIRNRGFQKNFLPIFPIDDSDYTYVSNINSSFIFKTNKNATNSRLIMVEITDNVFGRKKSVIGEYSVQEIIPEHPDRVLSWARLVNHEVLILCYIGEFKNTLEMVNVGNTTIRSFFPLKPGTISDFKSGKIKDTEFFFLYESFLSPETVYKCDVVTGEFDCEIHRQVSINNINLDSFETKQIRYKSKDGSSIPMYITSKKNTPLNAKSPAVLYGFDGSEMNSLPNFSITRLAFLEYFGGYIAHPSIRGGDDYGEKWANGGSPLNVQTSIDDFIGAAEFLIKNNYTRSDSLTIQGSSFNGGLLAAAAVNSKPQLFGAAVIEGGVLDMLRFQKFTIGYTWCNRFGCSDESEAHFKNLLSYSPLHNIKMPEEEGAQYPAILVTTGDHGDRVVPAHSYKYIATLQHIIGLNERQKNPLLLRVDTKGDGKSFTKEIETTTDQFAFLIESLGLDFHKKKDAKA